MAGVFLYLDSLDYIYFQCSTIQSSDQRTVSPANEKCRIYVSR